MSEIHTYPIVRLPICRTTQRTILPRILWNMTGGEWQGDGTILCEKMGICNNKKQTNIASTHSSNEEQPGCLGCIGGCSTLGIGFILLYPIIGIPIKQPVYWKVVRGLFVAHLFLLGSLFLNNDHCPSTLNVCLRIQAFSQFHRKKRGNIARHFFWGGTIFKNSRVHINIIKTGDIETPPIIFRPKLRVIFGANPNPPPQRRGHVWQPRCFPHFSTEAVSPS